MLGAAAIDWSEGLRRYRVWLHLALADIALKYRRTTIGPLWITASTGVFILAISVIFSELMDREFVDFLPFGAAGIISWYFIASTLNDGCLAFISSQGIYRNMAAPFSLAILRVLTRNLIVFAHNLIIFALIAVLLGINTLNHIPRFLVGIVVVALNLSWIATVLAVAAARFRDVQQMVSTTISILFLVTPIFWRKEALSQTWIYQLNPFTYLIDTLREALLGGDSWGAACQMSVLFALVGWVVALVVFASARRRLAFWL